MVNEWTRDDLPSAEEARGVFMETPFGASGFEAMLDAVVAHLNANGGLPTEDRSGVDWKAMYEQAERERDELEGKAPRYSDKFNRARSFNVEMKARAEKAERERDTEREVRNEAYGLARSLNMEAHQATKRAESAERERDEWKARAIEAEQDMDPVEEAAVAAFKAAWHRADEEGDEGSRVRRGIRAARHVLGQEANDE